MNLEKINYDKTIIGDCIMEKVSKVDGGVIESKYFAMKYLPSVDKSNPDLNGKCNLLISAMVMADAIGDNEDIDNLMRAFSEALLACKTEEELNNFSLFMNKRKAIPFDQLKMMDEREGTFDQVCSYYGIKKNNLNSFSNLISSFRRR